jgi:hypothetical protein
MRNLLIVALAALSASPAFADAPNMYSDTADISTYAPQGLSEAKIIEAVKNAPAFLSGGAKYKFGLHLQGAPDKKLMTSTVRAAAMMTDATNRLFYRVFVMHVNTFTHKVTDLALEREVNLADMHFTVNAGLIDRMVVVEDAAHAITLAFPLGVGGIDEAVMSPGYRILTPKFHGASLNRATVQPARTDPTYYRARPFMPISTAKGSETAIAFHITILDDSVAKQYGLNYLQRGFESHGCMRMREKDLMEFFAIVMNGADDKIPVDVDNHVPARNAQGLRVKGNGLSDEVIAYPAEDDSYVRVTRFPTAPFFQRDSVEHLVIMDRANGQPEMRKLDDMLVNASDFEQQEPIDSRYPMP